MTPPLRWRRALVAGGLFLGAAACASDPAEQTQPLSAADSTTTVQPTTTVPPTTTTTIAKATGSTTLGPDDRPARLVAPDDVTAPAPLLVLLHGYGGNADQNDAYFGGTEQAARRGLYVLLPNGTKEPNGRPFWDAAPACCNFTGTPVDDVAYLRGLIEEAIEERPIDPRRVYVMGHSNGGFMSLRMACEAADLITAVAELAGSDQPEESDCRPSQPVSVLHVHGTADRVIIYGGGDTIAPYPGALETVARWARRGGCDAEPTERAPVDLDGGIDGAESSVLAYDGCDEGIDVQLDTIDGGTHSPGLVRDRVGTEILDWLLDHSR